MKHFNDFQRLAHHTVSDWDRNPDAAWTLDDAYYISAPRSLKLGSLSPTDVLNIWLHRIAGAQCLPQGRIITYHRLTLIGEYPQVFFRNQAPLGSAVDTNTYRFMIERDFWYVDRIVNGIPHRLAIQDLETLALMWHRDRITWWNGESMEGISAITISLEREIDGVWVQQGDWVYDIANQWKDSAVNRCGIGYYQNADKYGWFDDTEIWVPV